MGELLVIFVALIVVLVVLWFRGKCSAGGFHDWQRFFEKNWVGNRVVRNEKRCRKCGKEVKGKVYPYI